VSLKLPPGRSGVLPSHYLTQAIDAGVIDADDGKIPPENVQPASLDLRLGPVAYRMRCSFVPDQDPVMRKAEALIQDELRLDQGGAMLERNCPYLIPLKERLALPRDVRAKANPKSSTGRVDVFTRVISDRSFRFDAIEPGYHGDLYLEVVPLSFPVRVHENITLNQLRLSVGRAELSDDEITAFHANDPLLFSRSGKPEKNLAVANGMFLSLDLLGDRKTGQVGYMARSDAAPMLDLASGPVSPDRYWEAVRREDNNSIVLVPQRFYLLMSNEAVRIPPTLASEMTAYDPTSGELRTHYAGFFDPGFGYDRAGALNGSRAALEVRAHDVAFMIEHRQRVCKLTFERMLEEPEVLYGGGIGSNYQRQVDTLGKHFRRETTAEDGQDGLFELAPDPAED
jgi:dCTP deaminase